MINYIFSIIILIFVLYGTYKFAKFEFDYHNVPKEKKRKILMNSFIDVIEFAILAVWATTIDILRNIGGIFVPIYIGILLVCIFYGLNIFRETF